MQKGATETYRLHLFFLINISSESLIEYVSQTDLKLPTFAVIQVSGEAFGRIIAVTVFVHRENRSVALDSRISKKHLHLPHL